MARKKELILIVDDMPTNLKLLSIALKEAYDTEIAQDGETAIELAKLKKPSLILMDILMPKMDGFETFRRLRGDNATKDIPVVFITSDHSIQSEIRAFQEGANDYITKPIVSPILIARIQNILNQVKIDEALKQSEKEAKKLSMAIENSPSSVFITNVNGKIEYVNPKFTEITGYAPEEVVGKNPSILKSGTKTAEEYKILWDTISSGKTWYGEFYNKKKNGELYWESASIASITDPYGNITNYVAVKEDITEKKKMEEELTKLATTDPLTGVANRRFFAERMESELVRFKRFGNPASFLMLDIDFFKKINDSYGHAIGDVALKEFARIARESLRKTDLVGRLGGEEFGILLTETDIDGAMIFAERLRYKIANNIVYTDVANITFTVSIGISEYSLSDEEVEGIIARADEALYEAKNTGRNKTVVYGMEE